MASRRRKVIGEPRKHEEPKSKWQHYENELAKRQYSDIVVAAVAIARKHRITVNPRTCATQIRKHRGVLVKTALGDTTTPNIVDIVSEYVKRRNRIMGSLTCTIGLMDHHTTFEKILEGGGTEEQVDAAKRLRAWFRKVIQYAEREGTKLGLRHLRPSRTLTIRVGKGKNANAQEAVSRRGA
jgi:hypothetical protein